MDLVLEARKEDLREVEEKHLEKTILCMPERSETERERNRRIFYGAASDRGGGAGRAVGERTRGARLCDEKMWLRATELGLGFKLCSGVSDVKDQEAMKRLFGLPEEEKYAFEG